MKSMPYRSVSKKMSVPEFLFEARLDALRATGEIIDFGYQRLKFVLAPAIPEIKRRAVTYTPDFDVVYPNNIRIYEIKGMRKGRDVSKYRSSSLFKTTRVKICVAAEMFPHLAWIIAFYDSMSGFSFEDLN